MGKINEVTPEELEDLLKSSTKIEVIDVREDDEVAEGIIENAIHIPLKEIPNQKDSLNKDKHYVIVCRSGGRSMKACEYLDKAGFQVSNMAGGMLKWKGEIIF